MAGATPKTLDDIAAYCGVSASTVSRVLNNEPGISESTRERVLAAAETHRFTHQRRKKQEGRANIRITVVIPDREMTRNNPFYEMTDILGAINGTFSEKKRIEVVTFPDFEEGIFGDSFHADGIILAFGSIGADAVYRLREREIPHVFLNRTPEGGNYVSCNHVKGMVRLFQNLVATGHRRIGYLGFRGHPVDRDRFRGYMIGTLEAGGDVSGGLVFSAERIEDAGGDAVQFFTGRNCDAVMCFNDNFAIGLINGLAAAGAGVPETISVTGFDNSPMRRLFKPEITTINLSTYEMAYQASRWLRDNILSRSSRILHCEVEGELLEGRSVMDRRRFI